MRFAPRRRPTGAPRGQVEVDAFDPPVLADLAGWRGEPREWFLRQRPELTATPGLSVLIEVAVWCRFLGDHARAVTAFRLAAEAAGRPRSFRPTQNAALGGVCRALAGDADAARRIWREGADELTPRLAVTADAAHLWQAFREGSSTVDPAAQGQACIDLAYCRLRSGDRAAAGELLDVEQALRTSATAQQARYYRDLTRFDAPLAAVLRRLLGPPDQDDGLAAELQGYVRFPAPERQAIVLDVQQAYPDRVPAILPPPNLEDALSGAAKRRLAALREGRPLPR